MYGIFIEKAERVKGVIFLLDIHKIKKSIIWTRWQVLSNLKWLMSERSPSGKTNTHLVSDDIKDTKEIFLGSYSPKSLVKLESEKVATRVIAHDL